MVLFHFKVVILCESYIIIYFHYLLKYFTINALL